jgi:hypothetical protein
MENSVETGEVDSFSLHIDAQKRANSTGEPVICETVLHVPFQSFNEIVLRQQRRTPIKKAAFPSSESPFSESDTQMLANGTLFASVFGDYTDTDISRFFPFIRPYVTELRSTDPDCPPEVLQKLAETYDIPVFQMNGSHSGERYLPKSWVRDLLPDEETTSLGSVLAQSDISIFNATHYQESSSVGHRLRTGRLTAHELSDQSFAWACVLAESISETVDEIRIRSQECSPEFAQHIARLRNNTRVFVNGVEIYQGQQRETEQRGDIYLQQPTPRAAALTPEERKQHILMAEGRLLKEDLYNYDESKICTVIAAIKPGLHVWYLFDPDCPPHYLQKLAQKGGHPIIHNDTVYYSDTQQTLEGLSLVSHDVLRHENSRRGSLKNGNIWNLSEAFPEDLSICLRDETRPINVYSDASDDDYQSLANKLNHPIRVYATMIRELFYPQEHSFDRYKLESELSVNPEVGFIGIEEYRKQLIRIYEHYHPQGVPIRLRFLVQKGSDEPQWRNYESETSPLELDEKIIASHMSLGEGKFHAMHTSGLHPDENQSLIRDVADADYWGIRAYLLKKKNLTVDYYCYDHEVLAQNDLGLRGKVGDLHMHTTYKVRGKGSSPQLPAWGHSATDGQNQFKAINPSVIAFEEYVRDIYANGGEVLDDMAGHGMKLSIQPVGNWIASPDQDTISAEQHSLAEYFFWKGRKAAIAEPGLQVSLTSAPAFLTLYTAKERAEKGNGFAESDCGFIRSVAEEYGKIPPIAMFLEVATNIATKVDQLGGKTYQELETMRQALDSGLPECITEARTKLESACEISEQMREDPLVQAALSVLIENFFVANISSDQLDTIPTVNEAFEHVYSNTYFRVSFFGQVIASLRKYHIDDIFADIFDAKNHGVIDELIRDTSAGELLAAEIAEYQIAAGHLAIDQALALRT